MFEYKCKVLKVVDGDTVDVDIDLGFGVILNNERIRIEGIDAPESRTSDKIEKVFGLAAKVRMIELLSSGDVVLLSSQFKGKFGRILGDLKVNGSKVTTVLLNEGYAVPYHGQSKEQIKQNHLINREKLMNSGVIDRQLIESL